MFNPELIFDPEIEWSSACIAVAAPSCDSWWDSNSECKCKTGCITPSWTSISGC